MNEFRKGEVFGGRYRIEGVLGGGGFATVFEAVDTSFGRRVALKVLRPDADTSYTGESQGRFQLEASTVANLQDPHTVTLFDHGVTDDGLLYLVFEYVAGTPLNAVIREDGPIHTRVATKIVEQVLQSLKEAHAAGVLHRDVKPENIIIHEYMGDPHRAKLVDFGLAKSTGLQPPGEQLTQSGLVMGTAQYTSPEAYTLQQLTPAADLFALGLVFYEMVVGEGAVSGGSPIEIAERIVRGPDIEVPGRVPEPARSVIERLLRKNPAERFQTADEVLSALRSQPETNLPGRETLEPYGLTSARQLSADDFDEEEAAPLTIDESALSRPADAGTHDTEQGGPTADAATAPLQKREERPKKRPTKPKTNRRKWKNPFGGMVGFVLISTLVLGAASVGLVSYLDIRMPWEPKPEPVEPASLPAKTFDVTSDDTAFFYVDWRRGIVFASSLSEIPASGRCAMILDSASDPAPAGAYYVVEAIDNITQNVTTTAIGRDGLVERAKRCDQAAAVAGSIVLSAEIVASELRIDDVERRAELRKTRRNRARELQVEEVGRREDFYDAFNAANQVRKLLPGGR